MEWGIVEFLPQIQQLRFNKTKFEWLNEKNPHEYS
jgi:hypothetical protein